MLAITVHSPASTTQATTPPTPVTPGTIPTLVISNLLVTVYVRLLTPMKYGASLGISGSEGFVVVRGMATEVTITKEFVCS